MTNPAARRIYVCRSCGRQHNQWVARCAACLKFDLEARNVTDDFVMPSVTSTSQGPEASVVQRHAPQLVTVPPDQSPSLVPRSSVPVPLSDVPEENFKRYSTNLEPLDRALGGGVVVGSIVVLGGEPGVGKCLGLGTPVLMADGRVLPVEQVKLGDRLMGPDGNARTVLSVNEGVGDLYRIEPIKGEPWICNDQHILTLVQSLTDEVTDVSLKHWLAQPPSSRLRAKSKLFSVAVDRFDRDDETLPIDPYFLGLWFGDGTKKIAEYSDGTKALRKIVITKPDPEVRAACHEVAKAWGLRVHEFENSVGCPNFCLVSVSRENNETGQRLAHPLMVAMRDLLGSDLRMPMSYTRAPREDRLKFLAGLVDSDGDLGSTNCFSITQKREDWAREIWWMARSLGFGSVIAPRKGRCKRADGSVFEGDYWRVSIFGDTDEIPTRIARKQAAPRGQKKSPTRTGFVAEPIGEGDFFGFTLDGDGRFLLGDFTVTHNSTLAMQMLSGLDRRALYVTGEETCAQVGERARRINADSHKVLLVAETDLDIVFEHARNTNAEILLIDSIQTVFCNDVNGGPGSITQVRECTNRLVRFAKQEDRETTIVLIGQVTSDGGLAGPKALKHLVDVVVEFEAGEGNVRIVWCPSKNRFGQTGRKGRFVITKHGLEPLEDEQKQEDDNGPINGFH